VNCIKISTKEKYCVYLHKHNDNVFYVGKGVFYRPFEGLKHGKKWKDFVSTINSFDVQILLWTNDEKEALMEEKRLIKLHKPICNQIHNGYEISETRKQQIGQLNKGKIFSLEIKEKMSLSQKTCIPIFCNETGKYFHSIKEAARVLKIHPKSISWNLRGKSSHVGGYTFQRFTEDSKGGI